MSCSNNCRRCPDKQQSPFLACDKSSWIAENDLAFAIKDGYPVSEGHALIVPKRQVSSWFDATLQEQQAIMSLVEVVKRNLEASLNPPDGYNIGINVGKTAGQTVFHLHVHVIPRYTGDSEDPRGGVRWVVPEKADYWSGRNTCGKKKGKDND